MVRQAWATVWMVVAMSTGPALADDPRAGADGVLRGGQRICLVGNALAERMQHHGWLETMLHATMPNAQLSVRNLGFGADTLTVRQRTSGFGSPDEYLARCKADVVVAFFGFNESFDGADGVGAFKSQLREFINHTRAQRYNGSSAPVIVLCSPVAIENLQDSSLAYSGALNTQLRPYVAGMSEVAAATNTLFIDLFDFTRTLYASKQDLTINGVHMTAEGNRNLAEHIAKVLCGRRAGNQEADHLEALRTAVIDKNHLWFNRYRATDGYNVYGGRSSLKYTDDVSNFAVLQREMEVLDVMVANRDRYIASIARGVPAKIDDRNAPPVIDVTTNKPGPLADGSHEFPSGQEAIEHMRVAPGLQVNLYADEGRFPELVNPVQMAWDSRGRLWVAVWPTYPHWEPHQPMNDKLLILEDTDSDGVADVCKTFAGDLHNPTGFEFWMGGVFVAQPPDVLFMKDTDGDDRPDRRERVLHGLSSADTHHSANSFVFGPDGALYFQEGTFHQSQIESVYGPIRNHNGAVWRFEPRTFRVERYIPYNFANPHGHVFDRWGQNFVTDGTGNDNYYALAFSGHIDHPAKHSSYFRYFKQRCRPCAATEILSSSHFPKEYQGNLLIADVIQFKGILQYRFQDDDSGFSAVETDAIVQSAHPTFRPSDIEVGPDGAVYFLDWTNPIIGHMQHHLRDPNRDHDHGRVYRVTMKDRPLAAPEKIAGQSASDVLDCLKSTDDRVRYRARIELSSRERADVLPEVSRWSAALEPSDAEFEHHLLEALWVYQQYDAVARKILEQLLIAKDPRARAAATRVVRGMRHRIPDALDLLRVCANDSHPRVRLEAVVAASYFDSPQAAAVALEVVRHPTDKFIDYALQETMRTLEPAWKRAIREGYSLLVDNPAGERLLLDRVDSNELMRLPKSPAVYRAMLTRGGVDAAHRQAAAQALATAQGTSVIDVVLSAVQDIESTRPGSAGAVIRDLSVVATSAVNATPEDETALSQLRERVVDSVRNSPGGAGRQLGYALWIVIDGHAKDAVYLANSSVGHLQDLCLAVGLINPPALRSTLADTIRPLMFGVPVRLRESGSESSGVRIAFYQPNPHRVPIHAFDDREPQAAGVVANFGLDNQYVLHPEAYALKFEGTIHIPHDGEYTFATRSDDGSRLYIDDNEVVDNDGLHGMLEKSGSTTLHAGPHRIVVTFFENGGGEGLEVSWSGPGIEKQPVPDEVLSIHSGKELRDAAVRAMALIPGLAEGKFKDAMLLIGGGAVAESTVKMIDAVPQSEWPSEHIRPLAETIGAYVQALPAAQRTSPQVAALLSVGRRLAEQLPTQEAVDVKALLAGLGGTVVLIRTVPHHMVYDVSRFQVQAGKPVAIVLQNNDMMPHNLVVTRPGKLSSVGQAAEALATRPDAPTLETFVPDSDHVLQYTALLAPGDSARLNFAAPDAPGEYPYVCTFPGHWMRMNGIMEVVEELQGDPVIERSAGGGDEVVVRPLVKDWKFEDLKDDVRQGVSGRSIQRGAEMFCLVGCIKCHQYEGAGSGGGPELSEAAQKYTAMEMLQHVLEPSHDIAEEYRFHTFVLDNEDEIYGRIARDDGEELHIIQHLQTPDEVTRIPRGRIRNKIPSRISAMPTGMLVILTRDEILDLVAYLKSATPQESEAP
jgi:putative heme-binding domain-containing protein